MTLTGEAETPSGDPVATGEAVVRLRRGQGQLCYTLEATNLSGRAAAAHIHRGRRRCCRADRGSAANAGRDGRIAWLRNRLSRPRVADPREPAAYYVNVHTAEFPGGAVRGQLDRHLRGRHGPRDHRDVERSVRVQRCGDLQPRRPGRSRHDCVPLPPGQVCYRVRVQNIRLPSAGTHIHRGGRASAGGIVVQMNAPDASAVASGCTATPQTLIDEILASPASFYNNVHTTDYPAGAIRGSLG